LKNSPNYAILEGARGSKKGFTMSAQIKKIIIEIDGEEKELSLEDAKELKLQLDTIFGDGRYFINYYPVYPNNQPETTYPNWPQYPQNPFSPGTYPYPITTCIKN
jgi:excinuclease UvrABC helicase subunit UvrB